MAPADTASDLVGERIKLARERRGWSQTQLAERCEEIGAPELTKQVIGTIERGRRDRGGSRHRQITIEEIFAFSAALAVPVLWLLAPLDRREQLRVTGERYIDSSLAMQWLAADTTRPPLDWPADDEDLASFTDARRDVVLVRTYLSAIANARALMARERADPELRALAVEYLDGAEAALWSRSLIPAPLPPDVADQVARWRAGAGTEQGGNDVGQ
jgi:transcriptional regulator with XRE-family HTH domain